jgi:uncharacterized membrane protein YbaN (DUF454 family)
VILGFFFSGMGFIGLFLPLLPTTPFLLLAAACFARSSEKFYDKLLSSKYLGVYIRNYIEKRGVPLKVKLTAITFVWAGMIISIIFATDILWIRIILVIIAIGVTIHLAKLKTED